MCVYVCVCGWVECLSHSRTPRMGVWCVELARDKASVISPLTDEIVLYRAGETEASTSDVVIPRSHVRNINKVVHER